MGRLTKMVMAVCAVSTMVFAAGHVVEDKTYLSVNGHVVSDKRFAQYQNFLRHFLPAEIAQDAEKLKKETEAHVIECFIVKDAAKEQGHEITPEIRQQVLNFFAQQNTMTVAAYREEMKKAGIDEDIFVYYQSLSKILADIIRDTYQDNFEVSEEAIAKQTQLMQHEQVDLKVALLNTKVATKEEKDRLQKVLDTGKDEQGIVFQTLGWRPINAFPSNVAKALAELKPKGRTQALAVGEQMAAFEVVAKRMYQPEREEVKEVLLMQFLEEKKVMWLDKRRSKARITYANA